MKKILYAITAVVVVGGWSAFAQEEESATLEDSVTQEETVTQEDSPPRKTNTPQKRRNSAGLRLGLGIGYNDGSLTLDADYRGAIGNNNGIEIGLSYGFIADAEDDISSFGAYELSGFFEWRGFITRRGGLSWYAGPGLKLGIYEDYDGGFFGLGVGGHVGIELDFSAFIETDDKNETGFDDLEYTIDIRPMYLISKYRGFSYSLGIGFRYTF